MAASTIPLNQLLGLKPKRKSPPPRMVGTYEQAKSAIERRK